MKHFRIEITFCCRLYIFPALTEIAQEEKIKPQAWDSSPGIMETFVFTL